MLMNKISLSLLIVFFACAGLSAQIPKGICSNSHKSDIDVDRCLLLDDSSLVFLRRDYPTVSNGVALKVGKTVEFSEYAEQQKTGQYANHRGWTYEYVTNAQFCCDVLSIFQRDTSNVDSDWMAVYGHCGYRGDGKGIDSSLAETDTQVLTALKSGLSVKGVSIPIPGWQIFREDGTLLFEGYPDDGGDCFDKSGVKRTRHVRFPDQCK